MIASILNKMARRGSMLMLLLLPAWVIGVSFKSTRYHINRSNYYHDETIISSNSISSTTRSHCNKIIFKDAIILRGGSLNIEEESDYSEDVLSSEDETEREDEDEEQEESDEEVSEEETKVQPKGPVKVILKTGLGSPLIDQQLEIMCSRTRTVASLKLSAMRQMRGRPPVSIQNILLAGSVKPLDDDLTIDDLVDDDEDDEEEEDEEDMPALTLIVDIPPPVDSKFGCEMMDRFRDKTTEEIVDAYAANAASLMSISRTLLEATCEDVNNEDEDVNSDQQQQQQQQQQSTSESLRMRQEALIIKDQLLSTLVGEEEEDTLAELLSKTGEEEEEHDEIASDFGLAKSVKRKSRKSVKGGATMNVKRLIQKNLNIDWGVTLRSFVLFLFFGYFGARDALSRAVMYIGAPMCFVLQARPVKVLIKQLFYAIGDPPGIIKSLLPAPQQAIMDVNADQILKDLYGIETEEISNENETNVADEENYDLDEYDSDGNSSEDDY